MLKEIRDIEFTHIDYDGESEEYYGYVQGTLPVLISAPHGCKHYRASEHRWREEDAYTSSLAIELGRLTGAHVLYTKSKSSEDPNNDPGTRYKAFLQKVVKEHGIKFVVDLHGADSTHAFKVDIGIMHTAAEKSSCPTFKRVIEESFAGFGPALFNQRFTANGEGTVTCFCRNKLGIEAAQIEINARYRIVESKATGFRAKPENVLDVITRLQKMIVDIGHLLAKGANC